LLKPLRENLMLVLGTVKVVAIKALVMVHH